MLIMKINSKDTRMSFILTGPECSGKTYLGTILQEFYEFELVHEYAREWLSGHGPSYTFKDVSDMCNKQDEMLVSTLALDRSKYVLSDTDILNFIVWTEDKFNHVPDDWLKAWDTMEDRYYLLCSPDIPWEDDLLREDRDRREIIFERQITAD